VQWCNERRPPGRDDEGGRCTAFLKGVDVAEAVNDTVHRASYFALRQPLFIPYSLLTSDLWSMSAKTNSNAMNHDHAAAFGLPGFGR
jgi:hypothetical protein